MNEYEEFKKKKGKVGGNLFLFFKIERQKYI